MRVNSFIPQHRKGTELSLLALLGGLLLIALQFLLPSVAFAFSTNRGTALATTLPDQALARAEVSVVRLAVIYVVTLGQVKAAVQCTGLGTLVSSEPAPSGAPVNWVLTDGELVTPNKVACSSTKPGTLSAVDVFANNAYTGTTASTTTPLLLGTLDCTPSVKTCDPTQTNASLQTFKTGFALFTFRSSALQPFVDVVPQSGDITPTQDITLTDAQNQLPPPLFAAGTIGNFLNPHEVAFNSRIPVANGLGMPIVNKVGGLTDIQLSTGPVPIQEAATFLNIQPEQKTNALHSNWNTGINKLYGVGTPVDAAGAATAFQKAGAVNSAFKAATTFRDLAISQEPKPVPKPAPTPNPLGDFLSNPLFWAIAGGALILIILLIFVSLRFGQARAQRRQELERFKAEEEEAKRRAEIQIQRQQQMRQPQAPPLVNKASTPPRHLPAMPPTFQPSTSQPQPSPQNAWPPAAAVANNSKVTTSNVQPASNLPCPNCGRLVQAGASYCPNCRYQLSSVGANPHTLPPLPAPRSPERDMSPVIPLPQRQEALVGAAPGNAAVEERLRRLWSQLG